MAHQRICSVEGCGKPHRCVGFCNAHYKRWRRNSTTDSLTPKRCENGEPLRFLMEIVLKHTGNECLSWPFSSDGNGYGNMQFDGKVRHVHRIVCTIVNGPPPAPDSFALHKCGNGHEACCAPDHLYWGDQLQNMADALSHGTRLRGERVKMSKLTEADVLKMRKTSGSNKAVATVFGVSPATVSVIRAKKSWSWLK